MSDVKIEEEQKPEVPVEASEATATGDAADDNNDEVCTPAYPRDFDSWLPTGFRPPSMRARPRSEECWAEFARLTQLLGGNRRKSRP